MDIVYNDIGRGYSNKRLADPRIAALIHEQMGGARRVLNIGAGTGSYEPRHLDLVALEPSITMISQRPADAAPAVLGRAETLPFSDGSFDLSMALLTLHHWSDWRQGLAEAARVAGGSVLLFTWIGSGPRFWLTDYFPQITELDAPRFPDLDEYRAELGDLDVIAVPIPHDCSDGFLCAYWRRPEAYLDPAVRASISTFSDIDNQQAGLSALRQDLASGTWLDKYGELLQAEAQDFGYCLIRTRA